MDEERRSQTSIGARMRGPGGQSGWGAWGGSRLPTATAVTTPALPTVLLVGELTHAREACREALAVLPVVLAEAPTAAEALRLVRQDEVALLVLDRNLPDMGGFELAALLRQEPYAAAAPVIFMLPGGADADVVRSAYRMGAADCLTAPLDAEILRQKARALVDLSDRAAHLRHALERTQGELRQLDSAHRKLQDQQQIIRQQATHDLLTGLPTRVLFEDRLDGALKRAARNHHRVAVAVIDLDGFKQVNERHGHSTGDELLSTVGKRLVQTLRASDTVARLGADEFAAVLEGLHSAAAAEHLGRKLTAAVAQRCTLLVELEGKPVELAPGASTGIAIYPDHGQDREALVAAAETAMYQAKQSGGGVRVHNPGAEVPAARIAAQVKP